MLIVGSAAYFFPCPACRLHGHIVTAAGEALEEVDNREDAYAVLEAAVTSGRVMEDEAKFVHSQIKESELVIDTECIRNPLVPLVVLAINRIRFGDEDEGADVDDEEPIGELHRTTIH